MIPVAALAVLVAVTWTEVQLVTPASCRYVRYLSSTNGYTNVAEVEFWGY